MATFAADVRDIKFVLFDQVGIDKLLAYSKFKDVDRATLEAVLDEAYKVARSVLAPANRDGDRTGAKYDKATSKVTVPPGFHEVYKQYVEGGWLGLAHSTEWGGQGMPWTLQMGVTDFMFGACMSFCLWPMLGSGAAHLIEAFGPDAQKQIYLRKMYSGEWSGTMCLTEPGAGSDVGAARTKARRAGDHYLIEGEKIFITYGEHDLTEQIVHAVLARTEDAPAGTRGLSLFLVPKLRVSADGSLGAPNDVRCAGIEHKMGIHGSPTCTMVFGEKGECQGWLLGEEGKGMRAMFQMMNEARINVGLQGAAGANAAYQFALQHAKERAQGKTMPSIAGVPAQPGIVGHPDVKQMLLMQKAIGEGTRALIFRSAFFNDVAGATADPAERETSQGLADLLTPIAKGCSTDLGFRSVELSVQTLGGYGYTSEFPVEQYLRDMKIASIYEGTNGIQALDLVGRKLPQSGGKPVRDLLALINQVIEPHLGHPALGADMKRLADARDQFASAALSLAAAGGSDPQKPMLEATGFLELTGQVVIGWLLLEQAAIAYPRLQAICTAKGVAIGDPAALARLCEADEDAKFYDGKVKTAQFWARRSLPLVRARAEMVKGADRSALEITF